uniref:Vacuolar protein sorting-associated protein 8 homolog n=1 Tax=Sinocyclocheilus anshuiensis TaxID=1608454 RepID=A0A671L6X6_9TELE
MAESPDSRSLVSASSQLNLMEIEAIDDKEFDIPQVDTPPTLESILNEPEEEDEPFILEDTCLLNTENIDAHSCETSSLSVYVHLRRRKAVETNATVHGSVLRRNLLKGISAQIVSAADKVDAGLPTAITVSNVIAVGTSHGLALVFDQNQALRLCLGTTATGAEYGAVSALSINHDCTRLLCGFAKGQITMWDLANGKLLRTITDAHPPGTAILHVKFTDHPALAVCNDSGGSVFELSFRRVMGMRTCESRCLFSGSKGEVCCVEPLHAGPELKDHPITHYSLLAMASLTKILLIGLKPSLKVWMTFPYGKTDPASVPLLAWQFVAVQKTINPVLAFCRGDTIHFLLVKKDESGTIHVIKQRQLQLNCDLISLSWINLRTLVLMDSTEKLRVVDRPSQEELETVDMAELQLVYNSSHFKSLATGGNVSQALALVGEKTCYQSVCSYAGQIMYLGTKRVDHLLKQEKFMEALSLAWSFHEGTAKAMVEILLQYVDRSLKKCPEQGKIQAMEQHFQDMVPVTVDYCLLLQRTDLLFNQIYPRLVENSVARGVFLESLEPYILSERIGCLTAPVMRDLLSYFQENGMMDSVEGCLVHMDITNLDIQQVVQMCWDNQLYDAMIYVFNSGMNDYISPMEKLFQAIGPPLREGKPLTDEHVVMGNKLLVYISCCLAGRAYPLGDIPEDLVPQVKNQVFEFLIRLHSVEAAQEEEVYPYIRTLLHFDTREFLNVLALTFEDFKNDKQALEYQQRIVDILLKVMVDNSDFTPSQVGCLFTFLARQLAKPDNTLFVNRKLFDQVLEFLCSPDDDSRHTERQQVLLELLQVGGVVQFDEGRLLDLAEKTEFYQICEFIYEKKHLYDKIVDCYLKDPLRKEELFNYIHNILSMPGYSSEEKQLVWVKALQHIKDLVSINSAKTAELVAVHFADKVQPIITSLQVCRIAVCQHSLSVDLISRESLSPQTVLKLGPDLHELLVDLLCQFSPQQVIAFLKTSQDYRLEEAIQITEKHKLHEATAYLLEKKGDVQGAFEVLLQSRVSAVSENNHHREVNLILSQERCGQNSMSADFLHKLEKFGMPSHPGQHL